MKGNQVEIPEANSGFVVTQTSLETSDQHVPLEEFSFLLNMYEALKLDYPERRL